MFFRKTFAQMFLRHWSGIDQAAKKTANTAPVPLYARSYSRLY